MPPAYPTFSLLFCPPSPKGKDRPPPPPSPPGKGETISFFARGSAPGAPASDRLRHRQPLPLWYPGGGLPSWSPAAPAFSLLFCPLPRRGRIAPRPRSQSALPCGKGETISLFCRGLRPLHPGVWTGRGTGSASIGDTRRGARVLVAGSPCHRYTRRGGANKAGTLKIHRAADRRQAAGRSSRAEYSEVPGIVGPLSGSDGSFFVILPDRRSSFCGEKRPPG